MGIMVKLVKSFVPDAGAVRPSDPRLGQEFFDTVLGYPIWYNGSDWVNSAGSTV